MRRNGGRTCKLRVRVHTAKRIRETIGRRARSHIIGMQGTARAAAGCNGEVLLACLCSLLLVCTSHRMLESCGVRGVTGNGYIHVLFPHDCHSLGNGVSAVAVYFGTKALGIRRSAYFLHFVSIRIVLGLYKGKAVDTGNDLCSIFSKTVQDNTKRFLADFIRFLCDTDGTLCGCKGLMTCQKCKAVRLLFKEHLAKITMTKANLTSIGHGAGNTECLQALTNRCSSVSRLLAVLLDCDSRAYGICPACVLKTNRLDLLHLLIYIQAGVFCDFLSFFDRRNAIAAQYGIDFINSSFI